MKLSLFTQARLKLTFWYLLVTLAITGSISFFTYQRSGQFLNLQAQRIERRYQREMRGFMPHRPLPLELLDPQDIQTAKGQLAFQLILLNAGIASVIALSGFFLSGKALEPVQKVMDKQKRFIADAAHELKTPITALKTSLEVNLMDKKISTQTKKLLKENLEDVQRLERLTHHLLKLSRTSIIKGNSPPTNLALITMEAVKSIQPLANNKSISIESKLPHNLNALIDKESLLELLLILLDNAVKYSHHKNTVTIRAKKTGKFVTISVEDQGIGISKRDLPHIFDRFYRADTSRSKLEVDGYGLGLSVAHKIVSDFGGSISVKSQKTKGSTFTIKLPVAF